MTGLVDEPGHRRLVRREVEVARPGLGADVVIVEAILRAELDVVLSADVGHIDLPDGGAVIRTAPVVGSQAPACSDTAALVRLPSEIENREVRARDVLQPDLRRPVLIDVQLSLILPNRLYPRAARPSRLDVR